MPKAGRTGVIGGLRKTWLHAHIGPLFLDTGFALLFGAAAAVAFRDGVPSALLPLLLMSIEFLASALLTGAALLERAHAEASAELAAL